MPLLADHFSEDSIHKNEELPFAPRSISNPASSVGIELCPISALSVMMLSPRLTVVVLAYVTRPLTVKLAVIFTSPVIVPPAEANLVLAAAKAPFA